MQVSPGTAIVRPLGTQAFAVNPPTVTWSIQEGSTGGSISTSGVYTAPARTGTFTIVAIEPSTGVRGEARVLVRTEPPPTNLTIPTTHPRLWFAGANDPRLAQARAWYAANPFTPASGDNHIMEAAFAGLLTTNAANKQTWCRRAIDYALGHPVPDRGGNGSDNARWHGEKQIVTYDWCYDQMTAAERANLIADMNSWIAHFMPQQWGGIGMLNSNYFWGNLRNELEWGIASYHENTTAAETFIADALGTRWNEVVNEADGGYMAGGVNHEGSGYGYYPPWYAIIPFETAGQLGREVWGDGPWWRSVLLALIYSTTPAPTYSSQNPSTTGFDIVPFSDDQTWRNGASATVRTFGTASPSTYFGDFARVLADHWPTNNYGRWAQQWLATTGAGSAYWLQAVSNNATTPLSFSSLPLDYHASGIGWLFSRSSWTDTSRAFVNIQLGMPIGVGHQHPSYGSWMVWRGGRWLSRETVAYAGRYQEYGGVGGTDLTQISTPLHNMILMNPDSQSCVENPFMSSGTCIIDGGAYWAGEDTIGPPVTRRLQSDPGFSFVAVDVTNVYRHSNLSRTNPAAGHVERDFVYVRDLETLVIFDRLEANAVGSTAASAIRRAFLAHCEVAWTVEDATHATCVNGPAAMRVTTLVPRAPSRHVSLHEGQSPEGQYRLEVEDTPGTAQSYFLHVVQARAHPGTNLSPTVTEDATSYQVTLDATHSIVFQKGMASSGGSITIGSTTTPFRSNVQHLDIAESGPVWQP